MNAHHAAAAVDVDDFEDLYMAVMSYLRKQQLSEREA